MLIEDAKKEKTFIKRILRKIGRIWLSKKQKKWRKRLKNKDFSIICSTCIGGVIYHDLGLEFKSPTINMFINNLDFVKFACDLKQYCSLKLRFIETDDPFPVAMCGDIQLNFNHAKTREEAESNWERRKARINYDNLYLIFYYREGYPVDRLKEIEKARCKRIALLTHKPLGLDYEICLKGNGTPQTNFIELDSFGVRYIEKEWDFVSWLNGD